jgi:endonuclease/exonuclease/phosphatase (EEP) superfamily protein YafD
LRAPATIIASLALAFSTVALVFRVQPVSTIPRLVLAVGSTFVPLIALTGLILALVSRRVVLSIVGVFLVTATVAIQVNWYYTGRQPRIDRYTDLRVLSSNLRYGRADPQTFVKLAKASADVITVAELTKEAVESFSQAGLEQAFPYSQLTPAPGPGGIGIWSRYPLAPVSAPRHRSVSMPAARVAVPGLRHQPLVASVHVQSPVSGEQNTVADWANGMAGAKAQLDNFAREAGPAAVIIGGDYNSTPDMRQFRDLLTNGYVDSVEQLGSGFAPTFKADSWLPPVITIDHILTRNAAASTIKSVKIKGSDHRALLATIRIPLDPAA